MSAKAKAIVECDAVVVGLGAHGSAGVYHLAKAGLKVVGIEQFRSPRMSAFCTFNFFSLLERTMSCINSSDMFLFLSNKKPLSMNQNV